MQQFVQREPEIDVNVKVDKALDDFFGDVDDAEQKIDKTSSATQ